jgi:hypothetical protein
MFPDLGRRLGRTAAAAALAGSLALSACAPALNLAIDDPSPTQIVDYMGLFQSHWPGQITTGGDYVWAGYAYVDHHCAKFFAALEKGRMQLAFAKDTTAAGFGLANTVMTELKRAQSAIGIVGAVGTFVGAAITSYQNSFFFEGFSGLAQFAGSLWLQTTNAQSHYKFENPTVSALLATVQDRALTVTEVRAKAHNIVQGYARTCTIQQMHVFINTALAAKPAEPDTGANGGEAGAAPPKQGRNLRSGAARAYYPTTRTPKGGMGAYVIR